MQGQLTLRGIPDTPIQAAPTQPTSPESLVVTQWTGRDTRALRLALRMTIEEFTEHLGVHPRTAAKWNTHPDHVTVPELQRALDTALARAPASARQRFALTLTAGESA